MIQKIKCFFGLHVYTPICRRFMGGTQYQCIHCEKDTKPLSPTEHKKFVHKHFIPK